MSTVKGVDRTKLTSTAPSGTDNLLDAGLQRGKLRVYTDTYEASALQIDDIIQVCKTIPADAYVIDVILWYDALGASTTLDVGDGADDDRYITAQDTSSAGVSRMSNIDGFRYKIGTATSDNIIQITLEGAAATGTIKIAVITSEE